MKKLFTLLTLLLCVCGGAWAEDIAIFSASPLQTLSSNQNFSGGDTEITSTYASISGGAFYASNGENSSKTFISKQSNAYAFASVGSKQGFKVVLEQALVAGDIISVNALTNGSGESNGRGIWVTTSASRPNSAPTCSLVGVSSSKEYVNVNYTVATGDGLCGETTFYIWRATGNSTYFKDFAIVRPAPAAPTITTQPVGASYVTGAAINPLTVEASGTGTITYQWYKNTENVAVVDADHEISGATAASYTPTEAGFYYVVITDDNGSVTSDVVEISISAAEAPTVSVSGAPTGAVAVGTEVTLTATATGNPTPIITWYDGTDAEVGTGETFSPSTATAGTYTFYAVASNGIGTNATSAVQTIDVKEQVATPTINPNGAYFDGSQDVTLACETEEAAIQYSTDNGETWTNYIAAFTITETTTVQAKATKDGCIDSEVATATFNKVTLLAQTDVTGDAVWDWSTITSGEILLKEPILNEDVVMANIPAYGYTLTVPSTFDAQALLINCQYVWRNANSSKFLQGNKIQFNTTVAGIVTIEYANTGNNAARTVVVNGSKGSKSSTANNSYQTESFSVNAGSVEITGAEVSSSDAKMLRIRKVSFTTPVTITPSYAKTTYVTTKALDFTSVDGLKAYVATGATSTGVTMEEVTAAVPAGTPLVLVGNRGTEYTVPVVASATAPETNLLVAGDGTTEFSGDSYDYILGADGLFHQISEGKVAVDKAYLHLDEAPASGARSLAMIFGEDTTTGISATQNNGEMTNGNIFFNLSGQRVAQPARGLYIVNGKKVMVK
ncbi:MAG: chitobiase/beta-hexosaminidase C-terminal domain-containing protein [Prevotella sp.]|nr:chitobiase/beta-hexosaminidase C-terminal domain-containing protein [Prevotella sp.]